MNLRSHPGLGTLGNPTSQMHTLRPQNRCLPPCRTTADPPAPLPQPSLEDTSSKKGCLVRRVACRKKRALALPAIAPPTGRSLGPLPPSLPRDLRLAQDVVLANIERS